MWLCSVLPCSSQRNPRLGDARRSFHYDWADNVDALVKKYGLEDIHSTVERWALSATAFSLVEAGTSRSQFGGAPLLPPGFQWPTYMTQPVAYPPAVLAKLGIQAPAAPSVRGLDFLIQIDLSELTSLPAAPELPSEGLLTFFYDVENQPWGYDPAHLDGFRVVLVEDNGALVRSEHATSPLTARGLRFSRTLTVPHLGSRGYRAISAEVSLPRTYLDFVDELEHSAYPARSGLHRMLGHSANVQGDMQLEAQLVSNGLYCGDSAAYESTRAKALEPGAADWVLLLQLDSDDSADIMWGDAGMLYFWIRRDDLLFQRFERTWATLQCG